MYSLIRLFMYIFLFTQEADIDKQRAAAGKEEKNISN